MLLEGWYKVLSLFHETHKHTHWNFKFIKKLYFVKIYFICIFFYYVKREEKFIRSNWLVVDVYLPARYSINLINNLS